MSREMQEVMSPDPFAAEAARVRASVRVALAAIVAVVVLGAAAAAWSVAESRRSLREQVLQTNLTSARIAASVVAAELNGHLDLVEGFAGRPSLVASVSTGDWEAAVGHLRSLRQVDGDLSGAAPARRRGPAEGPGPARSLHRRGGLLLS